MLIQLLLCYVLTNCAAFWYSISGATNWMLTFFVLFCGSLIRIVSYSMNVTRYDFGSNENAFRNC